MQNRNWRGMLYLFANHYKLNTLFSTQYFDFKTESVRAEDLKKDTKGWSSSEKFMLDLALHLYNSSNQVDLSGMDLLDGNNTDLALEAIIMRYGS